ncbi:MAG: hypothetical protein HPY83_17985 [Anaerolineae bacterium]|nr:hypothetical protein [Anaerolineae bacterium]
MRTVFGLFRSYEDAETAVHDLLHRRFDPEQINVVAQGHAATSHIRQTPERDQLDLTESLGGTAFGLDRLLAGKQSVAVRDAGELLAAGDLAVTLVRTASAPGAAGEGLRMALLDLGVPNQAAEAYRAGVQAGGVLLILSVADERAGEGAQALQERHASHMAAYNLSEGGR